MAVLEFFKTAKLNFRFSNLSSVNEKKTHRVRFYHNVVPWYKFKNNKSRITNKTKVIAFVRSFRDTLYGRV